MIRVGGALTVTWVIVAYLFWRKRARLPQMQGQTQSQTQEGLEAIMI